MFYYISDFFHNQSALFLQLPNRYSNNTLVDGWTRAINYLHTVPLFHPFEFEFYTNLKERTTCEDEAPFFDDTHTPPIFFRETSLVLSRQ